MPAFQVERRCPSQAIHHSRARDPNRWETIPLRLLEVEGPDDETLANASGRQRPSKNQRTKATPISIRIRVRTTNKFVGNSATNKVKIKNKKANKQKNNPPFFAIFIKNGGL